MLLGVRSVEDAEALVCAHCILGADDVGSVLIEHTAALSITSAAGSTLSLNHPVGAEVAVRLHWAEEWPLTTASPRQPASVASDPEAEWLHFDPRVKWLSGVSPLQLGPCRVDRIAALVQIASKCLLTHDQCEPSGASQPRSFQHSL
jgi:hypothetical protein